MEKFYLIGDVGGTNSRFALVRLKKDKLKILKKKKLKTSDRVDLKELVLQYLSLINNKKKIDSAVFAIAGRVNVKTLHLTNSDLEIDVGKIKKELNVAKVEFINDFTASAYSVEKLKSSQLKNINRGVKTKNKTKIIIGAGTGLGKATIFYDEKTKKNVILSSEGGHNDFGFVNSFELELVEYLRRKLHRKVIEQEDLVSGRGIEHIYEFLSKKKLSAKEISERRNKDKDAKKTFELFYKFYARIAKDFALDELSEGGVYLAGGIINKNIKFSKKKFVKEFTYNSTYSLMLSKMPIYVVKDDNINLYGLVNYIEKNCL